MLGNNLWKLILAAFFFDLFDVNIKYSDNNNVNLPELWGKQINCDCLNFLLAEADSTCFTVLLHNTGVWLILAIYFMIGTFDNQ